MAELQKCPFCGGEAKIIIKDWDNKADEYKVVCTKCGASMEDYYFNKERAIRLWNNRATGAELRASVIDEFAEKIRDWKKEIYTNERYAGELDFLFKHIDEIASKMKGEKE